MGCYGVLVECLFSKYKATGPQLWQVGDDPHKATRGVSRYTRTFNLVWEVNLSAKCLVRSPWRLGYLSWHLGSHPRIW